MDSSNWRTNQGTNPTMDTSDWRAQLPPEARQRIVNKIMDTLKKHLPVSGPDGLHELRKIAQRFEDKIFTAAISQPDYLRKISLKMLTMENKSQNTLGSNMPPNQVGPSNKPPDQGLVLQPQVQNHGQQHSIPLPNQLQPHQQLLSQNIQTNVASQPNLAPVSSLSLTPSQNIVQNSNIQNIPGPNSVGSTISQNSNLQNILPQNQQSTNVQQSTQSMQQQHSQVIRHQQQTPVTQQQQQLMGPQSNTTNMQHAQMLGQQNNVGDIQQSQRMLSQQNNLANMQQRQQQLINQQNNPSNIHQQLGNNGPGLQQQHLLGHDSGNTEMQTSHHSAHMLQQSKPAQLQQHLGLQQQPNPSQRDMQQRIQASGSLLQQQNVLDQQKQLYQSQRTLPETSATSLDSTTQTAQPSGVDWQEEVYQKLQTMKESYLPEMNEMYQKIANKLQKHDSLPQQPKSEQIEKLRAYKMMLERMMEILQIPKNNILPNFKEKLGSYEKQIINLINSNRPRKGMSSVQLGQLPPTHMSSIQQPQSQVTQVQSHENQMNSQMQSTNLQGSVPTMQQNNIASLQHNSLSSVSTGQQNMMNSMQPGTNLDSGQVNSVNSLQQVPMSSLQQNPATTAQQTNNNSLSSQGMVVKPGVFQQHLASGQHSTYSHQQLKQGSAFPVSSPQLLQAASPQVQQHSSPQFDQQNHLPSKTKVGTPLQSSNSPFVGPTPSPPLAPFPMPGESEKSIPCVSSISNAANIGHQQTGGAVAPGQSLAIGTPGISASPLLAEVKSISSKTLSAAVRDIGSVVVMNDRIAGSAPGNGSRAAVGEDLVSMTNCRLQARNFITQDGSNGIKRMKRYISAIPLNAVSSAGSMHDSIKHITASETSDLESTATSSVKKPKIEVNHALLEEIREINHQLIDTVVDISDEDVFDPTAAVAAAEGAEGIIVKCSFIAVALSPSLKSQYASAQMSPIQPLRLLVPANYPNCSPILLDKFPVESSKESEDLSVKAKSRFSSSLRSLSQPMSLGEIARTWDVCARNAISEHAQKSGGGSFSSKYGTWENCLTSN
uniref:Uncharacterized protein n=1 Tax=Cajanus cajan TaxID=3821 RepID=A0A151QYE0_CAJCA|nr:hypothetical protein KK1_043754 [Cajanus cajan]